MAEDEILFKKFDKSNHISNVGFYIKLYGKTTLNLLKQPADIIDEFLKETLLKNILKKICQKKIKKMLLI